MSKKAWAVLCAGLAAAVLIPMLVFTLSRGTVSPPLLTDGRSPIPAPRTFRAPVAPQPPVTAAPGMANRPMASPLYSAPVEPESGPVGRVAATPAPGQDQAMRIGGHLRGDETDGRRAQFNTEAYDRIRDNPFLEVAHAPLSTFSIDVDTASYANVRRFLAMGQLPPKDSVRIEELINYFRFDYPQPSAREPFSVTTEAAACPWASDHKLVLVGLQGRTIEEASVPPRNLTFLIDVSGSMAEPSKLPLLKASMGLLVNRLRPQDRVAIVVYAGASGLALPPTTGEHKEKIREALSSLQPGGSTAGGAGIQLAYSIAEKSFVKDGINRVILATDGDFNVGVTNQGDLVRLIEEKRKTGVFLSVLGFGAGNLKDSTMEKLADAGNGNYSYIDTLAEGRKVLVTEGGGTLVTIAKDVKIQVEFNPSRVAAYRLIGYENRLLRDQDFNDDKKDAGEIGAGHSVTALYEIVPVGAPAAVPGVDPLKYQTPRATSSAADNGEWLTVKLRHKAPDGDQSSLQSVAVRAINGELSANLRFASAVAAFGMLLRDSEHKGSASYERVLALAESARGADPEGYRAEFVGLVRAAGSLSKEQRITAR